MIRVLVVDENPAVRRALATRLNSAPAIEVVQTAHDIQEGGSAAEALRPDVVLLELKERGNRSPAMARQMAGTLARFSGAVIVLTSYADEDEREMALLAGARRYLLKNIDSARLIAEIQAVAAEREIYKMKKELVKDWMSEKVISVTSETRLPEIHRLMTEHRVRRLPVVDDGELVGIVTYGDVRGAEPSGATSLSIWEINYLLSELKAEEIMTPDPITIHPEATIGEAAQIMLKHKISGLPVLTWEGDLVGVITESDIFRMIVHDWISESGLEKVMPNG